MEIRMPEQDEFNAASRRERVVGGEQCTLVTAELRNQLQTIINNIEVLAVLEMSADARACVGRLDRAVVQLIRGLIPDSASRPAESGISAGSRCSHR